MLKVDMAKHEVTANNKEVYLAPKEFEILATLLKHRGNVLSRAELFAVIWGVAKTELDYDRLNSRMVDQHISRLRVKLGKCAGAIKTIPHYGYKAVDGLIR